MVTPQARILLRNIVLSGVISPLIIMVISIVTLLITPLITTPEPPSRDLTPAIGF